MKRPLNLSESTKAIIGRLRSHKTATVLLFIAAFVPAVVVAFSYQPMASVQPELGTLSGGAASIVDSNASGGESVRFGADVGYGPFPTPETTGPRTTALTPVSGGLTSSYDGQVIENMEVTGRVTILHDNVTVRDTKINGTGTYMITTDQKANGECPVNAVFEYIEIDGTLAAENDIPIYSSCGNMSVDHAYIHEVGRTSRLTRNMSVTNSYIFSSRTGGSGAHRGAVGTNGGSNFIVRNNVLRCAGTGCSAAIPNYGDFSPVENFLIEHNLISTTGGYCVYGGSLDAKPYPDASDVRFINNHFSTEFYPTCGQFGVVTGFENGVRGNVWSGNVWHESGQPINL